MLIYPECTGDPDGAMLGASATPYLQGFWSLPIVFNHLFDVVLQNTKSFCFSLCPLGKKIKLKTSAVANTGVCLLQN